ncbi:MULTISPECIES: TetR/AcrR family transcriptional regulator [unclassified Microbacterium]|uniref:TetR/AcrR family transcriptional regulator n=1 Tax=unclassified Microbacterium TaxID=2609290 RepID=UPI000EA8D455|nr:MULTISPECIES: TetR/AcrR family transcriptional regulator [unclassified Microbacterium]MBT2483564.1 TetR/AcrR family transcriptional regulator [Microbacterium sp. ISL-108]RKN66576.1 TetR/AcrR family transcriptional regulator [Microbacterium sp. CGR2]
MPKIVDYEKRREELATALLEVLARDGIEGVSVRSVAAHAGWTRGVISHYFSDRDELLLYAYRLALQREHAAVESHEGDPVAALIALLVRALPIDETSSLDYRIFLGLLGRLADRPDLAASLATDHAEYEATVLKAVRLAIETGAIRSALPPESLAHMLSVYVDGLTVGCAINPEQISPANLEEKIASFIRALTQASAATH